MTERIICIDTEYDARYSERGLSPLACMSYSTGLEDAKLVGAAEAAELWLGWARDPSVKLLGHSVSHDISALADEAHRRTTHRDGVPGFGEVWELAHRLYDDERVIDTEIGQRLTHVRFGPHKAAVRLSDLAKALFGEDLSDAKTIPAEARAELNAATPYADWPEGLLARTPWRVKFGWLVEEYGADPRDWPDDAQAYALEDVRLPWRVLQWQQERWGRPIPDLRSQTRSSWRLHVLSIPGWCADRERAQSIKALYATTIDQCEEILIDDGAIYAPGKTITLKRAQVSSRVFEALGDAAPLTGAAKALAAAGESVDRRLLTATNAKAVSKAIKAAGATLLDVEEGLERARGSAEDFDAWLSASGHAELNAYALRAAATSTSKNAIGGEGERLALAVQCEPVLAAAGIISLSYPRTFKRERVRDLVYWVLGDDAPMTETGEALYYDPTPKQRHEFCATDAKAVRDAIITSGSKLRSVVDAVEQANDEDKDLPAWLKASGQRTLNTYAVWTKATKTVSNFLDRLDTNRRIRTTYVTTVDTGRTASRGSGGPGTLNIQQLPRDYDKPPHLHVRGCITPDPGWSFIIADYSQLELCALAHVLNMLVRWYAKDPKRKAFAEHKLGRTISTTYESTLAKAINNDQDCHVLMASVLLSMDYAECYALYKRADAKKAAGQPLTREELLIIETRQLAKPCNFGFPGGLGARKFIDYAAGYGVTIDFATAKRAKLAYELTWVEMKLYFWHVGWKVKQGDGAATCYQLYSKRERGDCFFTQFCNSLFQALAADGAKEALGLLIDAAYRQPESPMYGTLPSGFVHDEFLVNSRREQAERALPEVERLMVKGMRKWIPDVKIKAPGKVLHERWSK